MFNPCPDIIPLHAIAHLDGQTNKEKPLFPRNVLQDQVFGKQGAIIASTRLGIVWTIPVGLQRLSLPLTTHLFVKSVSPLIRIGV
jgi:hypothetical protein